MPRLSRAQKRLILEAAVSEKLRLPKCWLADLIHSQMATGNFAKMANDAMIHARNNRRDGDVTLYRNLLDQVSDYWAQREQ